MEVRKKYRGEAEVFTEALNDILFILLMFFSDCVYIGKSQCGKTFTAQVGWRYKGKTKCGGIH